MLDILQWVKDRHEFWWIHLLQQAKYPEGFDTSLPKLKFTYRVSNYSATSSVYDCAYNVNYILKVKEQYDSTIAHELCHTFVSRLQQSVTYIERQKGGHCSLWFYMFNVVCGFTDKYKYHSYGKAELTEEAKLLKKYKKLLTKIATEDVANNP